MLKDATTYRSWLVSNNVPPPPPEEGALWCPLGFMVKGFFSQARSPGEIAVYATGVQEGLPPFGKVGGFTLVEVNQGAWVVKCPCGSAQFACRTDPRMYCPDCRNVGAKGAWVQTVWPDDVDTIEALLFQRLYEINRNWQPHETIDDLRAENAANAVGGF